MLRTCFKVLVTGSGLLAPGDITLTRRQTNSLAPFAE